MDVSRHDNDVEDDEDVEDDNGGEDGEDEDEDEDEDEKVLSCDKGYLVIKVKIVNEVKRSDGL